MDVLLCQCLCAEAVSGGAGGTRVSELEEAEGLLATRLFRFRLPSLLTRPLARKVMALSYLASKWTPCASRASKL